MKIWEYEDRHVKIIDDDGRIHIGFIEFYTSELDEPDGIATISLRPDGTTGYLIDFTESDIASIEVIPSSTLAVAHAV
ncbi:MAG: hypothetical protein FWC73_11780 [Defluviitaleaceae bacterium]|nr:hypothetical protein [Defluviitaleaceae bacterium]